MKDKFIKERHKRKTHYIEPHNVEPFTMLTRKIIDMTIYLLLFLCLFNMNMNAQTVNSFGLI